MDVQCERCKTEYEFDDALVSGRGTTVRCTHCGHQFKVRRAGESSADELQQERWVVTTSLGTVLTYITLRELQRAILAKQVSRGDTLAHGARQPRLLGSITELEPFFDGRASSRPSTGASAANPGSVAQKIPPPPGVPRVAVAGAPRSTMKTEPGLHDDSLPKRTPAFGSPAVPTALTPLPPPVAPAKRESARPRASSIPDGVPPPRGRIDTLRPPASGAAVPPPSSVPPVAPEPTTAPVHVAPVVAVGAPAATSERDVDPATVPRPPPYAELSSPLPPPTRPIRRPMASSIDEDAMAEAMHSPSSLPGGPGSEPFGVPRRRRALGWIVALIVVAGAGVAGFAVLRPYLAKTAASAAPELDGRVKQFLDDGKKALADGNLELAGESFAGARALAETHPEVLLQIARLAAVKADLPWLKLKLLAPEAQDEAKQTDVKLKELRAKSLKTADDALAAAPESLPAIRAKIDALRIAGQGKEARELAPKITSGAVEPESLYVLAALDLSENQPSWPTVVKRLREAVPAEGNIGRARAALIFALARSGDKDAAKAELARLPGAHPLAAFLRAFVERTAGKADGGAADASPSPPVVDVSALPTGTKPVVYGTEEEIRAALKDPSRAKSVYEARLAANPSDADALCQLAAIARRSGASGTAIGYYQRVLATNPSYTPAILGLADAYWESGNQGQAVAMYKDYVDRFPENMVPEYVRQRAGVTAPAASSAAPSATASATPSATATATATATTTTTATATTTPTATATAPPSATTTAPSPTSAAPSPTSATPPAEPPKP